MPQERLVPKFHQSTIASGIVQVTHCLTVQPDQQKLTIVGYSDMNHCQHRATTLHQVTGELQRRKYLCLANEQDFREKRPTKSTIDQHHQSIFDS